VQIIQAVGIGPEPSLKLAHGPRVMSASTRVIHLVIVPELRLDGYPLCALCRHRHKAHLLRDFTAHSQGLAAQKEFGLAGLEIAGRMFGVWEEFRRDGDRARLLEQIGPLKEELRALLAQAARKSAKTKHYRIFANNLLKRWPALWTFTTVPGVEPTNNHAERGLRGAVIYRRLSFGSRSDQGERTIERLLSASVTCRLQRRSLFAYLTDVFSAKIRGDPVPLLA
ncbi:MAG: transposase, partial [Actinobacteria bacterium]|nr:transposase [Actinomycetota bacterium]